MPSWGEILNEIQAMAQANNGFVDLDGLRLKYAQQLRSITGRNVILYYTDWLTPKAGPQVAAISLVDVQGLMETFRGLDADEGLDLVLHSPGGDPNAAASIVQYMRNKFQDVRVIVPLAAMSAATMWALSADSILMGKHSQLGPIDPQMPNPQHNAMVPTASIVKQFRTAQEECAREPTKLSAWVPTLQQYYPGLLEMCRDAENLSKSLVTDWLRDHMFKDRENREALAKEVAAFFADSDQHISHSRGIAREQLVHRFPDLTIEHLEDDGRVQDAVLSLHHAVMHTLTMSGTCKIIENHLGRRFLIQGAPAAPPPV